MDSQHDEIKKFDRLAHDFWDKNGNFKSLHQVNPLRVKFITDNVDLAGKRVLDIGCGGGILSEALDEKGAIVTAVDLSVGGISAAKSRQQLSHSTVDYRVQSTTELLAENIEPFDVVCCLEMLEHVDDPQSIINDVAQLVKPDGMVFFSTLNKTAKAKILAVWTAEYLLNMVPQGTHDPNMFIKPTTLKTMSESAGLTATDIAGFTYHPLKQTFSLSRDVSINYIMAYHKPQCPALPSPKDTHVTTDNPPVLGVLFDLDGTLVDSVDDLTTALNQYLTSIDHNEVTKADVLALPTYGATAFLTLGLGHAPEIHHYHGFVETYSKLGVQQAKPFDDTDALLTALNTQTIPWGIVTNKVKVVGEQNMAHFGYAMQTNTIVYGDTLPVKKPHPEPLTHAAELLDISPEYCVYIGDSKGDVTAAKNAGMLAIAVTYGYGHNAHDWGADYVVNSVTELHDLLMGLIDDA